MPTATTACQVRTSRARPLSTHDRHQERSSRNVEPGLLDAPSWGAQTAPRHKDASPKPPALRPAWRSPTAFVCRPWRPAHTHSCPALDSLLHSAASLTAITTIIGGEVTVVSFAAACCVFDLSMPSRALPCCRGSLAGRLSGGAELQGGDHRHSGCGGAAAQQLSWHMGRLGQATCASQAALAALCRPPIVRALPLAAAEKKCAHERSFCARSRLPERAQACQ